jgi:hypothetical protein
VRVSPDGQNVAYIAPLNGVNNLWVAPLTDPAAARPVTRVTDRNIGSYYRWAYTSRHLDFSGKRERRRELAAASVDITNGTVVPLTPEQACKSFLQEIDRKYPDEMLIRHNAARQEPLRSVPDQHRRPAPANLSSRTPNMPTCSRTAIFSCDWRRAGCRRHG